MNKSEVFGYIGLFLLGLSLLQTNIINLRLINIIATLFYSIQSIMLKSKSLLFTNFLLIIINVLMLF